MVFTLFGKLTYIHWGGLYDTEPMTEANDKLLQSLGFKRLQLQSWAVSLRGSVSVSASLCDHTHSRGTQLPHREVIQTTPAEAHAGASEELRSVCRNDSTCGRP